VPEPGYDLHERPTLTDPVLVAMLTGWIDAGAAGQAAMAALADELGARTIATFDGDVYIDYRARRPLMELREGINTNLVWPTIELLAGQDLDGRDALLLTGHEPDAAWHRFVEEVTELTVGLGARRMVGLGAYPFATPHSRPSRVSISCSSDDVAASLPYLRNSVDVPAGIQAALERAFGERGLPAIGLWAQVPHYVSASPYPPASIMLLTALHEVSRLRVDAVELREEAVRHRARLDQLVAANPEHVAVLHQLEEAYDSEAQDDQGPATGGLGPLTSSDLLSGDELAAELERFLRDQGGA
jgi:predicted ATP-grasp superfamily ATP-dependent carboligase